MCGTDCQGEDRPNFHARASDPAQNDGAVRGMYWYHSSTHANWPNRHFDPAAQLTDLTKRRMAAMLPPGGVEQWADGQKTKALHLGTYEAAIENMFRRIQDQDGSTQRFWLYRVRLRSDCVIEPGVHPEPTSFVGDTQLSEVTAPGVNVFRYVNVHEDPSSISLAIELDAIGAVQRVAVPLPVDASDPWVLGATERLVAASSKAAPDPDEGRFARFRLWRPSPLSSEARAVVAEQAADLPLPLRDRFRIAIDDDEFAREPSTFPMRVLGLARLVTDPGAVLAVLDSQSWRAV